MKVQIKNPKDFWTGAIYAALGACAFWHGSEYPLGSAGRMGPGYFPRVIASLLVAFGAVAVLRSFLKEGERIQGIAIKPLVLIVGGVVAFGLLLNTLGLPIAMAVVVLMSAAASDKFRFAWAPMIGMIGLVAFCAVVFVKGLGVPMPLVGTWLGPILPAWLGG